MVEIYILTQLMFFLDFEIHDIMYWKIKFMSDNMREKARKDADFGILKYGFMEPSRHIYNYNSWDIVIKNIWNLFTTVVKFCLSMLLLPLVVIAYITVRIFGAKNIN